MCGLIVSIRLLDSPNSQEEAKLHDAIITSLKEITAQRGPDAQNTYIGTFPLNADSAVEVSITASVLGLRGGGITAQPLIGKLGVLGWNGQVFQGLDVGSDNDTQKLFERLEDGEDVATVLAGIEGPYAFVYLHFPSQTIHFQVDPLSRRSLLIHQPTEMSSIQSFILTSVRSASCREHGLEMRSLSGGEGGVINLSRIRRDKRNLMDWAFAVDKGCGLDHVSGTSLKTTVTPIYTSLPAPDMSIQEAESSSQAEIRNFLMQLQASVRLRIENIPPLESTDVARVAILFSGGIDCTLLAYMVDKCLPVGEPIDLINVAFERPPKQDAFQSNRRPLESSNNISQTDPIDSKDETYDVPDRITGREAYSELQKVCSNRQWRFVEINIGFEECQARRQEVIDIMYPSATDGSTFPLFFASRGIGLIVKEDGSLAHHIVKAKVYISGLGADEQLGGYARHRNAYRQGGWEGLVTETQLDITRLPTRNLSRDDRIISSHARDARYPYLDLSFIAYLSSLPIHVKCDPRLPEGTGDKRLLRLATASVGLIDTSKRVKRAMQFGTRSSKMGPKHGKGPRAGEQLVE